MNPSPNLVHQRGVLSSHHQLAAYFHSRHLGEVFPAPTDVILTNHDVFVPISSSWGRSMPSATWIEQLRCSSSNPRLRRRGSTGS